MSALPLTVRGFLISSTLMLWCGCATIFNGSTQEVRLDAPEGTLVFDTAGVRLPVIMSTRTLPPSPALVLRRNRDYDLLFRYKQWQVRTTLVSRMTPLLLLGDIVIVYGLFVDPFTGDWNEFDEAVRIRFPTDSTGMPSAEAINGTDQPQLEPEIETRGHGFAIIGAGFIAPSTNEALEFILPVCVQVGIGYNLTYHTAIVASFNTGRDLDILPNGTRYESTASYSMFDLGARFRFPENIFLGGGGGWATVGSDSLISRLSFNQSERVTAYQVLRAPINQSMPTLYGSIGVSGKIGFLEIRHSVGFARIALPNGETGVFQMTSIAAGVNLPF